MNKTTCDITRAVITVLSKGGWEVYPEHALGGGYSVDVRGESNGWTCNIEVKSSKQEYLSGFGLNFNAHVNYVAVPEHLAIFAVGTSAIGIIPDYVGVLAYDPDGDEDENGDLYVVKPARMHIPDGYNWIGEDIVSPFSEHQILVYGRLGKEQRDIDKYKNYSGPRMHPCGLVKNHFTR